MAAHDVIYRGPRPVGPPTQDALAEEAAIAVAKWRTDHPEPAQSVPSGNTRWGVIAAVSGALVGGVAIGLWVAPLLRTPAPVAAASETSDAALALPTAHPSDLPSAPPKPMESSAREPAAAESAPIEGADAPAAETAPKHQLKTKTAAVKAPTEAKHASDASLKVKTVARSAAPGSAALGCKPDGSRAQVIICADPSIAAADQEMTRAYQRALKSGTAKNLRTQQEDWLITSEVAAARSPADLAAAYQQRIAELNAIADDPPH